ncbi:MAG: hypothetical protein ACK6D4_18430, partial [Planctomyces sp.]
PAVDAFGADASPGCAALAASRLRCQHDNFFRGAISFGASCDPDCNDWFVGGIRADLAAGADAGEGSSGGAQSRR